MLKWPLFLPVCFSGKKLIIIIKVYAMLHYSNHVFLYSTGEMFKALNLGNRHDIIKLKLVSQILRVHNTHTAHISLTLSLSGPLTSTYAIIVKSIFSDPF